MPFHMNSGHRVTLQLNELKDVACFLYRWAGICIALEICGYKCNFMWRFFVTLCGKSALKGAYPPTESNQVESYPQRRGTLTCL